MRQRLLLCLSAALLVSACDAVRQPHFGVREGRLNSCVDIPGCLSSHSSDPAHRIAPLTYGTSRQEAKAILLTVLNDMRGLNIVSNHRNYMRAEMRMETGSPFPGASAVIDDVEFYLDPLEAVIHIRAEPRLSRPEGAANRDRIEELRARFDELHARYRRQNSVR